MYFQKPPLGTQLDWSNPLNDGVVLHLAMNEGNGDVVQDLSMNGHHGTLKNMAFPPTAASGWNPGQTGIGLNFDGTNDYVDCENDLKTSSAITVSALLYPRDLTVGNDFYVDKDTTFRLYQYTNDGRLRMNLYSAAASFATISSVGTLKQDAWQHILFTWDKAIDGGYGHIYWNGNETTYHSRVVLTADININTNNLYLMLVGTTYSNGSIDQVRIQNRSWTAKEAKNYAINPWQVYLDE